MVKEVSDTMDLGVQAQEEKVDMTNVPQELVFGLDIGTRSIVGTVGYKNSTNGFVAVAQVAIEHETRAMIDGQIHDIGQVAATISKIKEQLEKMTGRTLQQVCIAAAGRVLKTVEADATMSFSNETVVTNEHIYTLNMLGVENAYDILRKEMASDDVKFYCVGYSVKQYYQNDYPISNLEGHKATQIRTEIIATFLPDEVVDGLYAAVERAGLYVANLTLEPIAAINVAIPEKFRLLNIALVDVGAGTSDISITKDGSIIAYGMIPFAGDELTETIAKKYLTDFTEADHMKCASTYADEVEYHDIMGLSQKIPSQEIIDTVADTVKMITQNVSDRIKELNGGKPVSAIFVVGGGGKVGGFVENLAQFQGLPKERVALRGAEVLRDVTFLQKNIEVDSLLVTPIGICLNYYEQKNNFIFVTVNDERIKLYDNNKLTIMDAAMQVGYPNEDLFPKRGKTITYYVSGEKRMARGENGEAAVVLLNGHETGINTPIASNDKIEIQASTRGKDAGMPVGKLQEFKSTLTFIFNGKTITCSRFVSVNDILVSEFHEIQDEDHVEILDFYTLKQVMELMDILKYGNVKVNNMPATPDTKVYDNFVITCDIEESGTESQFRTEESTDTSFSSVEQMEESERINETEQTEESEQINETEQKEQTKEAGLEEPQAAKREIGADPKSGSIHDLNITVNGEMVSLKGKKQYIVVDILDFYPVDTSVAHGNRLLTAVNGMECDFTYPLREGDAVRIEWVN